MMNRNIIVTHPKRVISAVLVIFSALTFTGCSTNNTSASNQDVKTICTFGATINKLDNTKRKILQNGVTSLANQFKDNPNSNVKEGIQALQYMVSLDQTKRELGNKMLNETCQKI